MILKMKLSIFPITKESFDDKRKNFLKNFVRPIDINAEVGEIVKIKLENLLSKCNENN